MITIAQMLVMAGLVLILAELVVGIQTGFDLVLIGTILVVGGFTGIFTGSVTAALIVSVLLSMIYIAWGRSVIKQKIIVITKKTNIDKLIGASGVVVRSITPDTAGMVRVGDEDWRATSDEVLYEKDKIEVVAIEGVSLIVKKN